MRSVPERPVRHRALTASPLAPPPTPRPPFQHLVQDRSPTQDITAASASDPNRSAAISSTLRSRSDLSPGQPDGADGTRGGAGRGAGGVGQRCVLYRFSASRPPYAR